MIFWGLSFVWTSIVLKYYEPFTILFLRLIISAGILFFILKISGKLTKIRKEDYKLFFVSSIFNPFLYFIGETYGIKFTSSTISSVIIATIPVFTPVAAFYALKERLSLLNYFGLVISFSGILVMLLNKNLSLSASPLGVFLLFFAVASAIAYTVFLKLLSQKYPAIFIIAVQNLLGAIYFLPLFIIFGFRSFVNTEINFELGGSLLALAVFGSSLAFVFFTKGVKMFGISRTNVFPNTIPVFTAISSFYLLSEEFDLKKITGIVIVVLGVFLSQTGNIKHEGKDRTFKDIK